MIGRNAKHLVSVVLCILSVEVACQAADYYVDTAGNDGNSGLSASSPWRTVGKVNSFAFAPGDRVFFRRGQTWRERLVVGRSGTASNPILFGAYGTGNRPMFKGSALATGWTSVGSNRWRASLSSAPNQVFFNGTRGAKKSSQSGLTGARQWYWSSGSLYVYATSNPGSLYTSPGVEASIRPLPRGAGAIHIQGCQHVIVEGLAVHQSASFGLYLRSPGSYITVRDCEVAHAQDGGLVAPSQSPSLTQITFENCIVHHNNGGIFEGDAGNTTWHEGLTIENVDGFLIRGCHVYDNYIEGVNFKRGARNGVIENCTLYRNARINQYLEGATNIHIRYNKIFEATYNAGLEFGIETNGYHNDNVRIYNNLFWGNAGGISFWAAGGMTAQTRNVNIYNNTFYSNWEAIRWKSGATDNYSGTNYIRNNIIWQNGSSNRAIWDYTTNRQAIGRTSIAYNVFQQGAATHTTGSNALVVSDPGMVNPSGRDFHLKAGSPCIDRGMNLGLTRDFEGNKVPQGNGPDIGAYEYGSATVTTYTLSVSATNGTVTRTPNKTSYAAGETVSLQATPNSGYTFTGWSGALTGTANPATLVMDSNKSVTANFAAAPTTTYYTLTTSATNGTITRTPNKTSYASGETVTLQATPKTGYTFTGWSGALTGTTNPATLVMNSNKSVTANFAAITTTTTKTVGNTAIFSGNTTLNNRRAVPYTMPEAGQVQSISIYHQGGTGRMVLGVYGDSSGKPGSRLGLTSATTLSSAQGWQKVALQSPASVSAGQKIWLAWVFENNPGIRATAGTPGRADTSATWSGGMPSSFGTSMLDNYIYSIYATYSTGSATSTTYTLATSATNGTITRTPNKTSYASGETVTLQATPNSGYKFTGWSGALTGTTNPATLIMNSNKSVTANFAAITTATTKTVGNTKVFTGITTLNNRRAVPYTMPEAGQLQSISIYHHGGTGRMILAVYGDSAGKPGSRLGTTAATTLSSSQGWQKVVLQSPVSASAGQKIWLAWVFEKNPGIRATIGTPQRADTNATWSGGMPSSFGTSTAANYIHSIYATYSTGSTISSLPDGADSTTGSPNTMVILRVRNQEQGIDPASVSVEVDGNIVYAGDVEFQNTEYGLCRRSGTREEYVYTYQPQEPLSLGDQMAVVVNACDLAGNAMPEQAYLFTAPAPAPEQDPASDEMDVDRDGTTATDGEGSTWVVWQSDGPGRPQVYVSRRNGEVETADDTVRVSQGNGDKANPVIARDGAGILYVVWQEKARGDWDVYMSASLDGQAWTEPIAVVDSKGNQVNPVIAASVQPNGVVAVAWQDDRAGNQDIYVATSTDVFGTAEVSTVTADPADQTDPVIAVDGEDALFIQWKDARDGLVEIPEAPPEN